MVIGAFKRAAKRHATHTSSPNPLPARLLTPKNLYLHLPVPMRFLFGLAILFCCYSADAQLFVQGKVFDSESKEPLPFVNISVARKNQGATTGIDGGFRLGVASTDSLLISYVGYEALKIAVADNIHRSIFLKPKSFELKEVEVYAGENPAFRIIRRAIENASRNDPENLSSFSYNGYHKLFATAEGTFDTIQQKSSAVKFFEKHYLFLNETYSERIFVRSRQDKETIVGNRMSGVRDPFFAVLGNKFQSFSFYKPHVILFDQQYVNPISGGAFTRYDFTLEETRINGSDTSFIISFSPLPGKTFNGLKGILTINSIGYAVENVMAQPADEASLIVIKIQQKYSRIGDHWFPQELNSEFVLTEQKVSDHPIKYVHRTYISEARINFPVERIERESLSLEFAGDANRKNENFWNSVRIDTLSQREQNTYSLYDSMPVRTLAVLNTFVKAAEAIATAKIRVGKFYLPTEHLIRNNAYEGLRLGLGIQTGESISKTFTIDGYAAFGIKDKALKYGGSFQVNLIQSQNAFLKFSYSSDVLEPGNNNFLKPPPSIASGQTFRNWLTSKMDSITRMKMQFNFRPLRFAETSMFVQRTIHQPAYQYLYQDNPESPSSNFAISEAGIQFKFVYGEQFTQIRNTNIITAFKYPLIDFSISRSIENILDGDFSFTKAEAKLDYEFLWRGSAKTKFQISAGAIKGNAPYFSLFNGKGSNTGKFDLNSFVIPNYFQTMKIYEFTSDRYAYFFLTHDFGRIVPTRSRFFRPELSLHQNIGWGDLKNIEAHSIEIRTMNAGFYESGLTLTNLLRINYVNIGYFGLGGGVFLRYGKYTIADISKDLVAKINITFSL